MLLTHAGALLAIGGITPVSIIHPDTPTIIATVVGDYHTSVQIVDIPPSVPGDEEGEPVASAPSTTGKAESITSPPTTYSAPHRLHGRDLQSGEKVGLVSERSTSSLRTRSTSTLSWGSVWSIWRSMLVSPFSSSSSLSSNHEAGYEVSGSGGNVMVTPVEEGLEQGENCDCGHRGGKEGEEGEEKGEGKEGEEEEKEEKEEKKGEEKKVAFATTADLIPYLYSFFSLVFMISFFSFCVGVFVLGFYFVYGDEEYGVGGLGSWGEMDWWVYD